jgi:hypothetical protein
VVPQARSRPACERPSEQVAREVQTVDPETSFREKMCVPTLAARHIEDAGSRWKTEHLGEACYLTTVAFGCEERLVFVQVLGVEVARPPIGRRWRPVGRALRYASLSR